MIRARKGSAAVQRQEVNVVREGRFSRWSRLKQKGGADEKEEVLAQADLEYQTAGTAHTQGRAVRNGDDIMIAPEPSSMPGGNLRRKPAPVMLPLAGVEDGDTEFESPPDEALALLGGDIAHDAALAVPPVDGDTGPADEAEYDLSKEEQEIVAELPAIESLTKDSDFTPFLADRVPGFIRRRALSVLWRSDPILANLDGMNDYDEDYNVIDTLINIAKDSSYKVGKGYTDEADEADEIDEDESQIKNTEETEGVAEKTDAVEDSDRENGHQQNQENMVGDEEAEPSSVSSASIRDVRKPGDD